MKTAVKDQKEIYREVNTVTGSVHSVIFGTESLSELPVAELVQDFGLNISVCNRSVEAAVLTDAFDLLEECVFELNPRKVFLNFGETDLAYADFSQQSFLRDYRRLIGSIRSGCSCGIFVVSVLQDTPAARRLNVGLKALCREENICFVDVSDIFGHARPRLRLFSELIHHMREGRISFTEAMCL